jgi:ankyrin repeat protein
MVTEADLLGAFEVHSPQEIERILVAGVNPVQLINGKRPIDCLIEGYLRSPRFPECLRVMLNAGAQIEDPLLQALLLDDVASLNLQIRKSPSIVTDRLNLLSAFTCCREVTPLHICAEFNSFECGKLLIESGADVNAGSLLNPEGIGGQTPIFHSVNSIFNYCQPMMELLVSAGAILDLTVPRVLWGEAMPWETIVFDVTPVSYAQCGLFSQFHRSERHVYDNIAFLLAAREGSMPPERNVPNRYLSN